MKVFKNLFSSPLFLLKHIFLFSILNSLGYYLFNVFLFSLFYNNLSVRLDRIIAKFIINNYITGDNIFYCFCIILKTIIFFAFYSIAMNNDKEEIKGDIFLYVGDFMKSLFYIITTGLTFVTICLFSSIGIITGILFFDFCISSIIIAAIRTNEGGKKYSATQAIAESFKLTKNLKIKIFIFNNTVFFTLFAGIYFMPPEIYINTFNISPLLRTLLYNIFIVYTIKNFFTLEKIRNDKLEKIAQKEQEKQNEIIIMRRDI